jgi:hypothetical protein
MVVEPYLGQGAAGPLYGPAVAVACFVDDGRKLVRNELGEQVVSESTVYCRLETVAPPKSRVTVGGRQSLVIVAKRRDGGGLPTPDHLELALT